MVKCDGCRAVPRRVSVTETPEGKLAHYKCMNKKCRNYGQEVATKLLPKEDVSRDTNGLK